MHHFGHPVFWLAQDPNRPDRMYASVVHSTLGGVFVTNNLSSGASATWTLIPNPARAIGHPATLVVLNDGKLVATFSGQRLTSGFSATSGTFLYDPVAAAWSDVSDPGMHYWTKDIVLDPLDATQSTWYVGVFSGWGGPPNGLGGLYRTTNRGAAWTRLTGTTLDRVTSITFNPLDANNAYLTTEAQGLWSTANLRAVTPAFTRVATYPFQHPERTFFNPNVPKELWVASFGNGMAVTTLP